MSSTEEFEKCISNLIALAHYELHAFTDRLDYSKPYECKQATLEYMRYLGEKYEKASQEIGIMGYKAVRSKISDDFEFKAYQGVSDKDYMSSVDYCCKYLFGEVEDEQL